MIIQTIQPNEERKTVQKSMSQAEIKPIFRSIQASATKNLDDDPFQNLNLAVNNMNNSSEKKESLMSSDRHNFRDQPDMHSAKTRRQSGNLRQKQINDDSIDEANDGLMKETANFDELNKVIHEGVDC